MTSEAGLCGYTCTAFIPHNSFFYRLVDKYKIPSFDRHVKVMFYVVVFVS